MEKQLKINIQPTDERNETIILEENHMEKELIDQLRSEAGKIYTTTVVALQPHIVEGFTLK